MHAPPFQQDDYATMEVNLIVAASDAFLACFLKFTCGEFLQVAGKQEQNRCSRALAM
jgi:hypothetical protein